MPAAQQHGDENAGSEDGERDKADLYVAVGRDRHGDQRGDNVTAEERAGEGRLNGVGFGAKRLKVRVDNAQQHKAHRGHAGVHTEVDDGLLKPVLAENARGEPVEVKQHAGQRSDGNEQHGHRVIHDDIQTDGRDCRHDEKIKADAGNSGQRARIDVLLQFERAEHTVDDTQPFYTVIILNHFTNCNDNMNLSSFFPPVQALRGRHLSQLHSAFYHHKSNFL